MTCECMIHGVNFYFFGVRKKLSSSNRESKAHSIEKVNKWSKLELTLLRKSQKYY